MGTWVFTIGGLDLGMQLNANGEAVPYMLDDILPGTFTWEVDGTRVILHHVSSVNKLVWAAELTSETTMNGAAVFWAGSVGSSLIWLERRETITIDHNDHTANSDRSAV